MVRALCLLLLPMAHGEEEGGLLQVGNKKVISDQFGPPRGRRLRNRWSRSANNLPGYELDHKKFIGVNPKDGEGSGFIVPNIKDNDFGSISESNTGRNNMCTCDCKPGPDGIGCNGYGGIAFRYNSLLWRDPINKAWAGQMQAFQRHSSGKPLYFTGQDIRQYPGGPVIYNVACTSGDCSDLISGTFRQSNEQVKCSAAREEKEFAYGGNATETQLAALCRNRCSESALYTKWLEYCEADLEDKDSGFSGYKK